MHSDININSVSNCLKMCRWIRDHGPVCVTIFSSRYDFPQHMLFESYGEFLMVLSFLNKGDTLMFFPHPYIQNHGDRRMQYPPFPSATVNRETDWDDIDIDGFIE